MIQLYEASEYPITEITWSENGVLLDLTQGYTFIVKVANNKQALTATATVQAIRDKRPNVNIRWATTDISTLIPGIYSFQLKATDPLSKDRFYRDTLIVRPSL